MEFEKAKDCMDSRDYVILQIFCKQVQKEIDTTIRMVAAIGGDGEKTIAAINRLAKLRRSFGHDMMEKYSVENLRRFCWRYNNVDPTVPVD